MKHNIVKDQKVYVLLGKSDYRTKHKTLEERIEEHTVVKVGRLYITTIPSDKIEEYNRSSYSHKFLERRFDIQTLDEASEYSSDAHIFLTMKDALDSEKAKDLHRKIIEKLSRCSSNDIALARLEQAYEILFDSKTN